MAVSRDTPENQNVLLWIDVNDAPIANSQFLANSYSEEPTKVGTWITGDELFQKTIEITNATDGAMISTKLKNQYNEIKNMIFNLVLIICILSSSVLKALPNATFKSFIVNN